MEVRRTAALADKSHHSYSLFISLLAVSILFLQSISIVHANPTVWLDTQYQLDGSYTSTPALSTSFQSSVEALRTFNTLQQTNRSEIPSVLQFINTEAFHNTENLSKKIIVNNTYGNDVSSYLLELRGMQNYDGGYGELRGFDSTALDTAFAVEVFAEINETSDIAYRAITYLLNIQGSDGGWFNGKNSSDVYTTAIVTRALAGYSGRISGIDSALSRSRNYFFSQQNAVGLWGSDFESALTIIALISAKTDVTTLAGSISALDLNKASDQSWGSDAYSTALAIRAIELYNAANVSGAGAASASVTGVVILAGSSKPVSNADVSLTGQSGFSVKTNSMGAFTLTGIPVGTQTLLVQKSGYQGISKIINLNAGQVTQAGQLVIGQVALKGILTGKIYSAADGKGISGAQVQLTGTNIYSVTTDATGYFELTNIEPGSYASSVSKTGFNTVSSAILITGNTLVQLNLGLVAEGAYQDTTPGALSARTVDGLTGLPVSAAQITLSTGEIATTDANGQFTLAGIARGSYVAVITATGYASATYQIEFPAGAIGDLGTLILYPAQTTQPATRLTLQGRVLGGLSSLPVNNASIQLVETGEIQTTGIGGSFTFNGIVLKSFQLNISATGYDTRIYTVTVNAFGEVSADFVLSPAVVDTGSTVSTLSGTVRDKANGQPVASATIAIPGTGFSATSNDQGIYQITGINILEFALSTTATNYNENKLSVQLALHSNYNLDIDMVQIPGAQTIDNTVQIVSVGTSATSVKGNTTTIITAALANLTAVDQQVSIVGEVLDAGGQSIATLTPYAEGTTVMQSTFTLVANGLINLQIPWDVAQHSPENYQVVIRAVQPQTISRELPTGIVMAQNSAYISVEKTLAYEAIFALDPPLTQVGSVTPVEINALLINHSNVPFLNESFELSVIDPDTGAVLYQSSSNISQLDVGGHKSISFGTWLPTRSGNIPVQVRPLNIAITGKGDGEIYVGDKASGLFTVDKVIVQEGTQSVKGTIQLKGVDTRTGVSTDPLFVAVRDALQRGGEYVATQGVAWHKRNRCLGCHIQSQSAVGLGTTINKAPVNVLATNTMYNTIASSQQSDGGLRISHPQFTKTQTALGVWALAEWQDQRQSFRPLYQAARHLYQRRSTSGNRAWLTNDHVSGWWRDTVAPTALMAKAYAAAIRNSKNIDLQSFKDYTLQLNQVLGAGTSPFDIESGPDGNIYIVKQSGHLVQYNPVTNLITTISSTIPTAAVGLAIDTDGTFYVVGGGILARVLPDGTGTVLATGLGNATDVEFGKDGFLYITDLVGRVIKSDTSGAYTVVASGGLLSRPYGLAVADNGDIMITNLNGFNILKLDAQNNLSVFADGLAYQPLWIENDGAGGYFYTSNQYSNTGQYTPHGVNHVNSEGLVERLTSGPELRGILIHNAKMYVVEKGGNKLHDVVTAPMNTTFLSSYATEIEKVANFYLNAYQDGTSNNIVQAMRLTGLAEARSVMQNQTLNTQIDAAIQTISDTLKSRQRSNGGWGRYTSNGSDPMVTALVGIAIDYTNPSVDDPIVRNTIQYLLSTQAADKSWPVYSGVLSTRLASTSLVMAYLPKALDRLGGVDVDLYVKEPGNISLSNPSIIETDKTVIASGETQHHWSLKGVTGNGRTITFDLTLANLLLNESRLAASEAYLEFANSFTNEILRVDIDIPAVKATSELSVTVGTNSLIYQANQDVLINATVFNTSAVIDSGQVLLAVRPTGSTSTIVVLPAIPVSNLAPGSSISVSTSWNTTDQLIGGYEVFAQLLDAQGRNASTATSAFSILHAGLASSSTLTTDKPVYSGWDTVVLSGRVNNISANVILPGSFIEITVRDPLGVIIYYDTTTLNEILPAGLRDLPFSLQLSDAAGGVYSAELVVKNDFTRSVLTSSNTTFQVLRVSTDSLTGNVTATPRWVYQGDPVTCEDTISNISASDIPGINVKRQVLQQASGLAVTEQLTVQSLAANTEFKNLQTVDTENLALGVYYCMLSVEINGVNKQLAAAGFDVRQPPIKIESTLQQTGKGRLLVLLEPVCKEYDEYSGDSNDEGSEHECDYSESDDRYSDDSSDEDSSSDTSSGAPVVTASDVLFAQRKTYLEDMLTRAGWSYTITTTEIDFLKELHTGGYVLYALIAPNGLYEDEEIDHELQEVVNRGEGLVVITLEDEIEHALGIDEDTDAAATGLTLQASSLHPGGQIVFSSTVSVAPVQLKGAISVADFTGVQYLESSESGEPTNAITLNTYGAGKGVYIGFDLLEQARIAGTNSELESILLNALDYVHPDDIKVYANSVIPVRLQMSNLGIATPGQVSLTLSTNAEWADSNGLQVIDQNNAVWNYSLAVDQVINNAIWVRVLDTNPIVVTATIQTGIVSKLEEYEILTLNVTADPAPDLSQIITDLTPYQGQDEDVQESLKYLNNAQTAFNQNDIYAAHNLLTEAADELADNTTPAIQAIRLKIDLLIRDTGMMQ